MSKIYKLFTDGGARGNPGPAGLGAIIFDENNHLKDFSCEFIENATNNVAEYSALYMGLKLAKKNNVRDVICFLDSELIVKQMTGEYMVKNDTLKKLKKRIDKYLENFNEVSFKHVKRKDNSHADKLVNLAMDIALTK